MCPRNARSTRFVPSVGWHTDKSKIFIRWGCWGREEIAVSLRRNIQGDIPRVSIFHSSLVRETRKMDHRKNFRLSFARHASCHKNINSIRIRNVHAEHECHELAPRSLSRRDSSRGMKYGYRSVMLHRWRSSSRLTVRNVNFNWPAPACSSASIVVSTCRSSLYN